MKKIIISLITFLLFLPNGLASTTTFNRTKDNYLVPSDIEVSSGNESAVLNTPAVNADEKIYDFANLLTDSEEEKLYEEVVDYIDDSSFDLVIVTIDYNNKGSAMEYADDFFDYNDFGINSSRDGLLMLIDMDNREVYISTSGQAIKMYSDVRIDNIIDAGFGYLGNGKYYSCFDSMINQTRYYSNQEYPSSNNNLNIGEYGNASYVRHIPYLLVIFFSGFVTLIVSFVLYFKTRSVIKKQNASYYINKNNTNITNNSIFVGTHTTKVARAESSSSGGSSGGGSSFHSSSSGRSHGGGGRHF